MESKRLAGMVALVTGAGGGLKGGGGAGIARTLGLDGAKVAVNDLRAEYAEATVEQLRAEGVEAFAVVGDISNSAQANAMVKAVVDHFGKIDILVNNAALLGRSPAVERMPDDVWRKYISVNLTGPFYMSRAALPYMKAQRYGRIVNISSVAGARVSFNGGACYTASKAGVLGMTRHLAGEGSDFGITVNAIMPTGIINANVKANSTPEQIAAWEAAPASTRMIFPEEMGAVITFLASGPAGHISGLSIPLDNGSMGFVGDFTRYKTSGKDVG